MKSCKYLVECAQYALANKFGYWYGTFGQVANAALLKEKKSQYPNYYDQSKYQVKFTDQFGLRVVDCSGLLKYALWTNTPSEQAKYNATQDLSANGMINACTQKGDISSIPEQGGIIVWKDNHVGIYVGNGYVIEARGHDYGVVKTKLYERGWKKWGRLPWVDYTQDSSKFTAEEAMAQIKKVVDAYYANK